MSEARRYEGWLGALLGALALVAQQARIQPWTLDDAFISFRYAENFAAGEGLVYNPGEWVEGYTTFLWVFLLGIGHAVGFDTGVLAKALGLSFAVGTVGLVGQSWRFAPVSPREAGLAALLTGTGASFAAWVMPGMEVPLVTLLLTATVLATLGALDGKPTWTVGLFGALALMARPDSVVVVSVCLLGLFAGRRERSVGLAPVALLALYGPYFAWRFWAYGWLFPNTFYAKVGSGDAQVRRGLEYLGDGVEVFAPFLVLSLPGLIVLQRRPVLLVLWGSVLLHAAYVVAVGGDVMPAFRFLSALTPTLALLAAVGATRFRGWIATGATVAAALAGLALFHEHPDVAKRIDRGVVGRNGEEVGRFLKARFPADTLLATNTAGSVPYFSGFRTIDMLGLNDEHIAHREMPAMGRRKAGHEKADGAYVLGRDPDIVQLGSARGRGRPVFLSDRQIVAQPGFRERYLKQTHRLPSGARLTIFVRRGWPGPTEPRRP